MSAFGASTAKPNIFDQSSATTQPPASTFSAFGQPPASQPATSANTNQANPFGAFVSFPSSGASGQQNPAPASNPFSSFGGPSTSTQPQPPPSSNLFSSFGQNNTNTGSGGAAGTTTGNPLFPSTTPSGTSNLFRTSATASANPQPSSSFPGFGSSTNTPSLSGAFGSTTGGISQPQQSGNLWGASALGSQPSQATTQTSTLPFGQTQPQHSSAGLARTSKFNDLPESVRQQLEQFDASIQSQMQLSNELKAKKMGEDIEKATAILSSIIPSSDLIWNTLKSDEDVTRDLRAKLDSAIQDEAIGTQILDGFQDPAKNAYLQTHANFPLEYYTRLTLQMEARLQTYKNTIDIIERKFSSLAEPHKRSPQAISNTLRTQHALFMALASRAAELDIVMKRIRHKATTHWRAQTGNTRDPFDRGFGASATSKELFGNSILRASQLR